MESRHLIFDDKPSLKNPVLLMAFSGWSDAAESATEAATYLIKKYSAKRFARIDSEDFFEFSDTRPMVRLNKSQERVIEWPENEFYHFSIPSQERDVVVGIGKEPHFKWKSFSYCMLDFIKQINPTITVTMGAFLSATSHLNEVMLVCLANNPELAEKIGVDLSDYEGPTGIVGVLQSAFQINKIDSISLWGNVPHYLANVKNPKVAYTLLEKFQELSEISLDLETLKSHSEAFSQKVDDAISKDSKLSEYVTDIDSEEILDEALMTQGEIDLIGEDFSRDFDEELPPGDEVANEIEEIIRRKKRDSDKE